MPDSNIWLAPLLEPAGKKINANASNGENVTIGVDKHLGNLKCQESSDQNCAGLFKFLVTVPKQKVIERSTDIYLV